MNDPGYVCINRKIFQHEIFQDAERFRAWIDLIGNFARGTDNCVLKRGDLQVSLRFLAKRWNWSHMRVKRFLEYLRKEQMIEQIKPETNRDAPVFRISNYEKYNFPVAGQANALHYVTPSVTQTVTPAVTQNEKQQQLLISNTDPQHVTPSDTQTVTNLKKDKRKNTRELLSSSKTDDRLVPFRDFIFQEWKLRKGYDLLTNGSDWKQFNDMLSSSKGKDAFQLEYLQDYWLTFLGTPQSNWSHPLRLFVTKINEFASKKFQNQSKIRTYSQPVYQG